MRGIYINEKKEIVRTGNYAGQRPGLEFIELADELIPTDLIEHGSRKWRYADNEVVPANTDAIADATARIERNRRLADLDTTEMILLSKIRIIDRNTRGTGDTTAQDAELASLDATKQALRDLPQTPGWPHKITWPVYNG